MSEFEGKAESICSSETSAVDPISDIGAMLYAYVHPCGFDALV